MISPLSVPGLGDKKVSCVVANFVTYDRLDELFGSFPVLVAGAWTVRQASLQAVGR